MIARLWHRLTGWWRLAIDDVPWPDVARHRRIQAEISKTSQRVGARLARGSYPILERPRDITVRPRRKRGTPS